MINTTSARVAIAVATATGQRTPPWCTDLVQGSEHNDSIPAILHYLDAGRVLAAVDSCPEAVRCWLLTCYAADGYASSRYLHVITATLYLEHARLRTIRCLPTTAATVAGAVIGDMVMTYRNPDALPARPCEYTKAIGVKTDRYSDYVPMINSMQRIVESWDGQGLIQVSKALPHHLRERAA